MKLLTCPLNGPRNITEFTYGGEYHPMPDHQQATSREWAEHVFFHDNSCRCGDRMVVPQRQLLLVFG